jgi:hypothetical protein
VVFTPVVDLERQAGPHQAHAGRGATESGGLGTDSQEEASAEENVGEDWGTADSEGTSALQVPPMVRQSAWAHTTPSTDRFSMQTRRVDREKIGSRSPGSALAIVGSEHLHGFFVFLANRRFLNMATR